MSKLEGLKSERHLDKDPLLFFLLSSSSPAHLLFFFPVPCSSRNSPPSRRHQPLRNRKASGSALLCFFTAGCSCLVGANWPDFLIA
ncbi:hypothetical protein SLEP1_g51828 [Rubroshorea leprosula]|uniref:Uncharacterized protein n=1 Tax=Rubroshorea leprosula TaxID=152421 RepID=A0AAV5M4I7_9ROSI|nr:hypothetical protein SLEP1_g51828 [Rubroshorea leprosula]